MKKIIFAITILLLIVVTAAWSIYNISSNDKTEPYIQVLNHQSYPKVNGEWVIHFLSNGKGKLKIRNLNPEEVELVNLYYYDEKERFYKEAKYKKVNNLLSLDIAENLIIADWHYDLGKVVYKPIKKGRHRILVNFGEVADEAYNWAISTEVVSTESTGVSAISAIAIDSNNIYVVWGDETPLLDCGTDRDIFFKQKQIGGSWPTSTEVVSTESTENSASPVIAIDSNNIYVVWVDQTALLGSGFDSDIFFKKKQIGGSWPDSTEVVSTQSTEDSKIPKLAIDSNNIYVVWYDQTNLASCGTDWDIFFKEKQIGGSWPDLPTSTKVVSTQSTDDSTLPVIAVDSNNIYVAWCDNTNLGCGADSDIFFKKKQIGGSWPDSTEVVSTQSTEASDVPEIATDSNNICISWKDATDLGCGADNDIFFKKKLIGGSWPDSTEVVSTESTGQSSFPCMAVDPYNIYVAWVDSTDLGCGTDSDIFFKKKQIGGSWPASTEVVSTESTEASDVPEIATDSNNICISWKDGTNLEGCGTDNDIFFNCKGKSSIELVSNLPQATVGYFYNATLVTGGSPPYNLTVISGDLPYGLSLRDDGTIYGTPTKAGNYIFVIKAVEEFGTYDESTLNLNVRGVGNISKGEVKIQGGENGYVNPNKDEEAIIILKPRGSGTAKFKIFTLRGKLIKEFSKEVTENVQETINWDCDNTEGDTVSSGIYIVYIEAPGITAKKKVAVIR